MIRVAVLHSSENSVLFSDLREAYPQIGWIDLPMPFLPGRGENLEERQHLLETVRVLLATLSEVDIVFYARAYGAFSEAGRQALQQATKKPVISAPGAVLEYARHHGWRSLYVITPYAQARHDFEVQWAASQGFNVHASMCLGFNDGHDIAALTAEDLVPAIEVSNRSPVDGVYLACTITRTMAFESTLRTHAKKPIVSATEAMLWVLGQNTDAVMA